MKSITNKFDHTKEIISVLKDNFKKIIHSDVSKERKKKLTKYTGSWSREHTSEVAVETQSKAIEIVNDILSEKSPDLGKDGNRKIEEVFNFN